MGALEKAGLEEHVRGYGIPMYARMIHNQDGSTKPIPYGKENQCIYSVGRRYVNEILLDEGSKHDNITFHFNHKLLRANLETAELVFEHQEQDHKFSFLIETFTTFEEKKTRGNLEISCRERRSRQ